MGSSATLWYYLLVPQAHRLGTADQNAHGLEIRPWLPTWAEAACEEGFQMFRRTLGLILLVLTAAALVAILLPAYRAAHVQPSTALRYE